MISYIKLVLNLKKKVIVLKTGNGWVNFLEDVIRRPLDWYALQNKRIFLEKHHITKNIFTLFFCFSYPACQFPLQQVCTLSFAYGHTTILEQFSS